MFVSIKAITGVLLMLFSMHIVAQENALPAGCSFESFSFDGGKRAYILCIPSSLPAGPLPVVMGFHGGRGIPQAWMRSFPFHELGQREGFVTVYMAQACSDSIDVTCDRRDRVGWNVGKPGIPPRADDHGYLRAVLKRLTEVHGLDVDVGRVYGSGHSLGGIYLYSVACDMPDFFAAIGPISAPPTDSTCEVQTGPDIFHVHGTLDPNVPFDTGCCSAEQKRPGDQAHLKGCDDRPLCFNPNNWWPPVRSGDHPAAQLTGLDAFATAYGCKSDPHVGEEADRVTCLEYTCPAARAIEACLIFHGNHRLTEMNEVLDIRRHLWRRFSDR